MPANCLQNARFQQAESFRRFLDWHFQLDS
jgi:hypothetical protein